VAGGYGTKVGVVGVDVVVGDSDARVGVGVDVVVGGVVGVLVDLFEERVTLGHEVLLVGIVFFGGVGVDVVLGGVFTVRSVLDGSTIDIGVGGGRRRRPQREVAGVCGEVFARGSVWY